MRRGSAVRQSSGHDTRKRLHSSRGDEIIECASFEQLESLRNVSTSASSTVKSRFLSMSSTKKSRGSVPEIRVEQELSLAPETRQMSHDSFHSDRPVLPQPAYTIHGSQGFGANGSDGSFLISGGVLWRDID